MDADLQTISNIFIELRDKVTQHKSAGDPKPLCDTLGLVRVVSFSSIRMELNSKDGVSKRMGS